MANKKEANKKDAGKKDSGKAAAGRDESEISADVIKDSTIAANITEIETVEDLESVYPHLVSAVRDEVVMQIGKCSLDQVKQNMPEFYQRLVMDVQNKSGPNRNMPGFLLELDDPFAEGALRTYQNLMGIDGLRLPFVIPFKEKGKGAIRGPEWKKKFEKSEDLKANFKDLNTYIAFKGRIIVQTLESYILRAEGGGDYKRAKAALAAMKKIK